MSTQLTIIRTGVVLISLTYLTLLIHSHIWQVRNESENENEMTRSEEALMEELLIGRLDPWKDIYWCVS